MDARDLTDRCEYRRAERAFCAGRTGVVVGRHVSGPTRMYSPQGAQFAMEDVAVTCACGTTTVNPTGACPFCHIEGAYGVVQ